MTRSLRFIYSLYDERETIGPKSVFWSKQLPQTRSYFGNGETQQIDSNRFTCGDYFVAARTFLEKSPFLFPDLLPPERQISSQPSETIETISICLKKHGEFYHPSKIDVIRNKGKDTHVLNLAISNTGKKWAQREYQNLVTLNRAFSPSYIPRAYDLGASRVLSGQETSMFLGEWFEGYHEFHLSFLSSENPTAIRLWDAERSQFFLSPEQTLSLYRQATRVLLHYYNLKTFEQIYPWHHAAGDFVAKVKGDTVGVKLITVRGYGPLLKRAEHGATTQHVLEALLLFMLSVSIRMRLDRIDGVGEMAWSGDIAVKGVVDGFLKGLEQKSGHCLFPAPLADCFKAYLTGYRESDLYDLFKSMTSRYPSQTPETVLAKKHLINHSEAVFKALTRQL